MTQLFDVLDYLADTAKADPVFVNAKVLDGPITGGDYREAVAFGVPPPSETASPAVQISRTGPGGLTSNDYEAFSITGAVSVMQGDGDHRTARRRAGELYLGVVGIVVADMTLGRRVHQARMGAWSLWLLNSPKGAETLIQFEVVGRTQL